jgi:predicted metal-dependent hydrolase
MNKPLNDQDFNRGIDLFNRAHFFDAHEVLEDVWRSLPRDRPTRRHLQGMVQLAVAFHHESTGNHVGARSVLERAMCNLNGADRSFPDLDLDRLRIELELWRRYLDDSGRAGAEKDGKKIDGKKKDEKKLDGRDVRRHNAPALPKIMLRR